MHAGKEVLGDVVVDAPHCHAEDLLPPSRLYHLMCHPLGEKEDHRICMWCHSDLLCTSCPYQGCGRMQRVGEVNIQASPIVSTHGIPARIYVVGDGNSQSVVGNGAVITTMRVIEMEIVGPIARVASQHGAPEVGVQNTSLLRENLPDVIRKVQHVLGKHAQSLRSQKHLGISFSTVHLDPINFWVILVEHGIPQLRLHQHALILNLQRRAKATTLPESVCFAVRLGQNIGGCICLHKANALVFEHVNDLVHSVEVTCCVLFRHDDVENVA
mmetsp:Transcript_20703/g.39376  ORF Transcript_20703/g.39376 Transcript_20703/m.39376 type:complete len:271 (-) Transcript_20703:222-1034(-)